MSKEDIQLEDFSGDQDQPSVVQLSDDLDEIERRSSSEEESRGTLEVQGNSTVFAASFNFINSIVGAGMLGMSFAIAKAGFFFGLFLILLLGVMTDYSIRLLTSTGVKYGKNTYAETTELAINHKAGFHFTLFLMFLYAFSAMLSYTIIIGSYMPTVISTLFGIDIPREVIILLTALLVLFPLSAMRDISKLGYFSLAALISLVFISLQVIIEGGKILASAEETREFTFFKSSFFPSIGTITFAYICHHNTFLLYRSLAKKDHWNVVTHVSLSFAWLVLTIVAIGGFLGYGDQVEPNVLDSFSPKSIPTNISRTAASIVLALTYPIEVFVAREALQTIFLNLPSPSWLIHPWSLHWGITIFLCALATFIGLLVTDLGIVLELSGNVAAITLAYLIPGFCALKLDWHEQTWKSKDRWLQIYLLVFGIIAMFSGTFFTLKQAFYD